MNSAGIALTSTGTFARLVAAATDPAGHPTRQKTESNSHTVFCQPDRALI